jgi:hypothetical protein
MYYNSHLSSPLIDTALDCFTDAILDYNLEVRLDAPVFSYSFIS